MAADEAFDKVLSEARKASHRGAYAEALEASRRAIARGREVGSVGLEIRATSVEASTLSLMGRGAEAVERLEWVLGVARGERREPELSEARVAHAVVCSYLDWVETTTWLDTSRIPARLEALARADALIAALGKPGWRSGVLSLRASILRAQSRLDDAIALGEEAIRCFERGSPGYTLASYRQQHADVLMEAGRLESAEVQYMAILMEKDRSRRNEKSAHVGLAKCALVRGDAIEARRRAEKALEIAKPLGDSAMYGPLEILIEALHRAGELDHATAVADKLVDRARVSGNRQRLFYAVRRQIDLAISRDDQEGARAWLDEAGALAIVLDGSTDGDRYARQVRTRQARLAERATPSSR
jgi:tetratricopeptide (TPR) repeat protein